MLSVIVPVYMVENYLPQCIDSIINQTYRDIEIILVNDGSLDNCGKICDDYAKKDQRIRVFHKNNGGLSDARNYGIARANGEYLGFVDSDDWIEPNMFEILTNLAEGNKADIVSCGFYYEYSDCTKIHENLEDVFDDNINVCKALINDKIDNHVWNKIFRKSCFTNVAFPKGHVYEDISTMYKLILGSESFVSIKKPLYHYRMTRKSSIIQNHSMANLMDFWSAHKLRYEFFRLDSRFNTDNDIMDQLLYNCAYAIGRTWGWYNVYSEEEKHQYALQLKDMYEFAIQHFPFFGKNNWPIHVRISTLLGRFNNKWAFALLFYMFQTCRWIRKND